MSSARPNGSAVAVGAAPPPVPPRRWDGAAGPTSSGGRRPTAPSRRRIMARRAVVIGALVTVLLLAWPIGMLIWANGKVQHVDALSDAPGTPGRVYLLAGSDSRSDGIIGDDGTLGQRTDSILLLVQPSSGPTALVSLPRDTYVDIPGDGPNKLNAAFSEGGPPLLVRTVEGLSGMKVDHYVEIGMGGVAGLVDAVGGVELCYDRDVDDEFSQLRWTAGCHTVDGTTALAFARMRYADPLGDLGRVQRQQQLIGAVAQQVGRPSDLVFSPSRQVSLVRAGTQAFVVDRSTGIVDLGRMALAFRAASGPEGLRTTPPVADPDYRPGGIGSTVLLDEEAAAQFFEDVARGRVEPTPAATP